MQYEIHVVRGTAKGRITFKSGNVSIDTTCWWMLDNRVDAGTYTGYATRMARKMDGSDGGKRQAIWLGKDVSMNNGTRKVERHLHSQGHQFALVGRLYCLRGERDRQNLDGHSAQGKTECRHHDQ